VNRLPVSDRTPWSVDLSVPPGEITGDDLKSCCASFYEQDLVSLVLGESHHPGGLALTRRLAGSLDLEPGDRVLDVASGPGTTALLLAEEYGVVVDGVDLGPETVDRAATAAAERGVADRASFHLGDAEHLPFEDAAFDALVCECAFCTFPDKATAAREFARVLRPGGRIGITDVVVDPGRLDPELRSLAAWVACVADARPIETYRRFLWDAGLDVTHAEGHGDALRRMVETIGARLGVLKLAGLPLLDAVDTQQIDARVAQVLATVDDGIAGYALMVAERRAEP